MTNHYLWMEQRADGYAACAHRTQVRKYSGKPYIEHPRRVAQLVKTTGAVEFVVVAALLHDVREDCGVTFNEIADEFGLNVATLVEQVTDVFTKENFPNQNRAWRKQQERERLAGMSNQAQTIKVADLIDNTSDIAQHDKDFARVYLKEKRALLDLLTGADHTLRTRAYRQIEELERTL